MIERISLHQQRHPYLVSFYLAVIIFAGIMYFVLRVKVVEDLSSVQSIDLIDIDEIAAPQRKTTKDVDENATESDDTTTDRAKGKEGVKTYDLDAYPNVKPPRLISKPREELPKSARDLGVEAVVYVEARVSEQGRVLSVKVRRVILSKQLPANLVAKLKKDFVALTRRKWLREARYDSPIVSGAKARVNFSFPVEYKLR